MRDAIEYLVTSGLILITAPYRPTRLLRIGPPEAGGPNASLEVGQRSKNCPFGALSTKWGELERGPPIVKIMDVLTV